MDDETAIRDVISERLAALRRGDAEAFCRFYAPDAVVFSLAPPLRQPAQVATDATAMQAWIDEKGGSVWSEVRDLQITVDGSLAVCTSVESMGAPPDAPQPFTLWYRSTLALRRHGEDWRVVHEHTSTPFHMDGSFRAAIDLQP